MINKENIKTTDWLTRGMTDEYIQKEKDKAIKQADRELASIEKKEKKKEMRAYRKMHRRHSRELVKLAKQAQPFDYSWLDELVHTQIKHMHEYFSAGNNVWQVDETRLPIIEQLKHVLDLYDEMDNLWDSSTLDLCEIYKREQELYEEIYEFIGENLKDWWD